MAKIWNKIKYVVCGIGAIGLVILGYVFKSNKVAELEQEIRDREVKAEAKKFDEERKDHERDAYIRKEIEKGKSPDEAADFWNERYGK